MGNFFGTRSMEETFRRNQDFITEMNKIKTERHIQMHNQIRERDAATKIAHDRELVLWIGAFYAVSVPLILMTWKKRRNPNFLFPVIPLTFVFAYYADQAYGNKTDRIRQEAELIMQFEPELLELPCGLPTASSIDQARLDAGEKKKLHPLVPGL